MGFIKDYRADRHVLDDRAAAYPDEVAESVRERRAADGLAAVLRQRVPVLQLDHAVVGVLDHVLKAGRSRGRVSKTRLAEGPAREALSMGLAPRFRLCKMPEKLVLRFGQD